MADQDHTAKHCPKCNATKHLSMFGRSKQRKSGLRPWCKDCHNASNKQWREQNPDKAKAAVSRWEKLNPERVRDKSRRWAEQNREACRKRSQAWRDENPEKSKACIKAHYYQKRSKDLSYLLRNRVGNMVRSCLVSGKGGRRTFSVLGYSLEELRTHLERQFSKQMTWEAFANGEIHIDHIVPISSFNITTTECIDFRRAWALSNLRPLWASDNIRKKDKRTHLI